MSHQCDIKITKNVYLLKYRWSMSEFTFFGSRNLINVWDFDIYLFTSFPFRYRQKAGFTYYMPADETADFVSLDMVALVRTVSDMRAELLTSHLGRVPSRVTSHEGRVRVESRVTEISARVESSHESQGSRVESSRVTQSCRVMPESPYCLRLTKLINRKRDRMLRVYAEKWI